MQDLVRKAKLDLNIKLLTQAYKRKLGLGLSTLEIKVQVLKFNNM